MHIARLDLTNFRNYIHQELELPASVIVLRGDNAQGKTNLLEAIYLLATTKSPRAAADRELVNWNAGQDGFPIARLAADVEKMTGASHIEIIFESQAKGLENQDSRESGYFQKRVRVNGLARRAVDVVGHIRVVMFNPQDTDLIGGAPALRRRYLDATNSQIDPVYLRNLQQYNKVLWQRNHLLRRIREHRADPDELAFWDQQLIESGSYLITQRQVELDAIKELAREIHLQVTGGVETLEIVYVRSVSQEPGRDISEAFREALHVAQGEEIARGMSIVGPHRDDLRFLVGGVNLGVYGSRGQHRTIALSIKLAEARFMLEKTGDSPVLLLDDVLSELDFERRRHLLNAITNYQQTIITTTDLDHFENDFLAQATKFGVRQGEIEPL